MEKGFCRSYQFKNFLFGPYGCGRSMSIGCLACTMLLLFSTVEGLKAQREQLEFVQQLTISEGLAHNGVTSILEDSRGFIWIGSYDGLHQYDGYEVKIFKNRVDEDLFVSNRIRTINEDANGNLWIGTDEGISIYDYNLDQFQNIYSSKVQNNALSGPIVRKVVIDPIHDLVFCATEDQGLLLFGRDYGFVQQYMPSPERPQVGISMFDGIHLGADSYLFSTSRGLLLFDLSEETYSTVLDNQIEFSRSILRIDKNSLLATLGEGIAMINYQEKEGTYDFTLKSTTLHAYQFNSAALDALNHLWLGTLTEGILRIDDLKSLYDGLNPKPSSFTAEKGLLRTSCITPTRSGCWVGTFNKGVFRFDPRGNPFRSYRAEMGMEHGLHSNQILHVAPLDDHRIYLAANRGGLALFDTDKENFEPLPFDLPSAHELRVGAIFVDSKQNTWLKLGGQLGLSRVVHGQRSLDPVRSESVPAINTTHTRSILEDREGNIWIFGNNDVYSIAQNASNEIIRIESLNDHSFFRNNKIALTRCLYLDPIFDYLWIGTDADGLYRITLGADHSLQGAVVEQFLHDKNDKNSISSNFITCIVRLPSGSLWLGTERGGICKVIDSQATPKFQSFSEKHGLSNNVVKSIQYDEEENLWIATNIGLNRFSTKDYTFRRFTKEDGLAFEDFEYASAHLDNGFFVFAGLSGLCYFKPGELPDRGVLPNLVFGDVKVFNETIMPGDTLANRVLLDKRLNHEDKLTLHHDEDAFSIELKSLHFSTHDNHFLRYRLMPMSEKWITVPSDQYNLYYNGLPPGAYVLQAQASDALRNWTDPIVLNILITPPFWKTAWAYVLYFIMAAILVSIVFNTVLNIQKLNHKLEIEKLEKDKVKEVNAAKLRFFSDISHEIKTPLTLISGPVDLLIEQFKNNFDLSDKLQLVKRQSKKILQLIDQVQDFQKADAEVLKMHYSRFNFNEFIGELVINFEYVAKKGDKDLQITGPDEEIYISGDRDMLEKIFNNLLSNALKYTSPDDTIQVDYESRGKDLIVAVKDTGIGISEDDLPHVFERFYRSHGEESKDTGGSGIGLAFTQRLVEMHYGSILATSELHEGTTITVSLPIVKEQVISDAAEKVRRIMVAEHQYAPHEKVLEDLDADQFKVCGDFSDAVVFLVEDNHDMRRFATEVLSKYFTVYSFYDGRECLEAMEDQWPDIVISDVLMPNLNGLQLCKLIKADIKTSHIPVILLTACATIEDQIQGIRDGADAYIVKPFNLLHLVTKTESILLSRKKLRERYQIGIPLTQEHNRNNRNDNAFLERLYKLMADNLDNQDLNFGKFARELYLNRTHFYQKVKALTDHTPYELLKSYRLKRAAELLSQEGLSVNETFLKTGFKSRTHFSKLFKQRYHVSPGKYVAKKSTLKR